MSTDSLFVEPEEEGERLDKFLSLKFPDYSRTYFQHLITKGLVLINGELQKKRTQVNRGDEIEIEFTLPQEIELEPENIPLDILYEDDDLIVINKPAGLVVHPGAGNPSHTFVNALLYHCKIECETKKLRPGIVHRLDKETTGVLVAAKTEFTHRMLVEQFANRKVEKIYLAICLGNPGNRLIANSIGRHPQKRQEMTVLETGGKMAITEVQTLAYDGKLSVVQLSPQTGRTHQLRVHLKWLKTPILGDTVYGNARINKLYKAKRQLLHAKKLVLTHPRTKNRIELNAPLPDDIIFLTKQLL
ncbi:MAG: RluA family pseudouridine synthase [Chlamydiia bacterium]|nr:RluA family pseudouridine synthase [Chlamydiia bacterium]